MTILNRTLKRETAAAYRGRNIIIQLEPPSIVRVKEKGRKIWYETTVNQIFNMAAKQYADKVIKERKERRKMKGRAI
jgi:hypothetical protein